MSFSFDLSKWTAIVLIAIVLGAVIVALFAPPSTVRLIAEIAGAIGLLHVKSPLRIERKARAAAPNPSDLAPYKETSP